jgi:hypothetical protein
MTGDLYEDVILVNDAICNLHSMVEILEKECMERDKGKVATELFIRINDIKRELKKMVSEGERVLKRADIDRYGPLSKYVRPYLGF